APLGLVLRQVRGPVRQVGSARRPRVRVTAIRHRESQMNSKLMHIAALMAAVAALSACERKTTVVNPPGTTTAPAPSSTTVVPVPAPGPAGARRPPRAPGQPPPPHAVFPPAAPP